MNSRYAYSIDGTNWHGAFASRKEARVAALAAAAEAAEPPGVVFVGRSRPVDPQARGHADAVLREMNRRFRDVCGEGGYVSHNVTPQQRADLDTRLEQAIVGWLSQHGLLSQDQRVEAISEYPVPISPLHPPVETVEVTDMGEQTLDFDPYRRRATETVATE